MDLSYQLLIRHVWSADDALKRVIEDVRVLPVVETPLQFFEVAVHVLAAHLVEGADDRALEQAPHAFDAVSVHVTYGPLLNRMIDRLVRRVVIFDSEIGLKLVGVNGLGLVLDGAPDEVMQGFLLHVRDLFQADLTLALDGPGDDSLVTLVATSLALHLATYERFIHFNNPDQRRATQRVVAHGFADPVAEIPRGLVGDAQGALELIRGDALAGLDHHIDGEEPFAQRQVGIVHDGAGCDAKLVGAPPAMPAVVLFQFQNVRVAAAGATNAVRPAQVFQHIAALFIAVKAVD